MIKSSEISNATSSDPQSFKTQLKKLSGKSSVRTSSKISNAFDSLVANPKTMDVNPKVPKAKSLSEQEEQDNPNDSGQTNAGKSASEDLSGNNSLTTNKELTGINAENVAPVSNSVDIASLSINAPQDQANTLETAFKSQADTVISQASIATRATTSIASAAPTFSLAGLGAGLVALAALGGSKGGSTIGATQPATTPVAPLALSGFISTGPVINSDGLKVEAFDAKGNLLESTYSIQSDGTFSVNLKNAYTGVVKIVVSDTNGSAPNFIDEATGQAKSLGNNSLSTVFKLSNGQNITNVNVNTLTTEVANNLTTRFGDDLTNVSGNEISTENLVVATKYGFADEANPDALITSKPALLINANAGINQIFDAYGIALAIKSVIDNGPSGMQMREAIKSLAENPLYRDWSFEGLDWATVIHGLVVQLIFSGAMTDSAPTGGLTIAGTPTQGEVLTVTSNIADLDGIPTFGAGAMSYQWQASSDSGTTWTDIPGATANNFTITQSEVSKLVRVVATYTDILGTTETVHSAATNAIALSASNAARLGAVQSFAAGDINHDGISDWLFTFKGGGQLPGKAYVIYGDSNGSFDLSIPATGDSSTNMFGIDQGLSDEIPTPVMSTHVGFLPIILGDMNGNGKGDVAFATQRTPANPATPQDLTSPRNCVYLSEATSSFLRVITTNEQFGLFETGFTSITSGDINGDGFNDLFLGDTLSGFWDNPTHTVHPKLYVMFGNTPLQGSITTTEMSTNGHGLVISNSNQNQNIGFATAVAFLGDCNGDGFGDLAISNSFAWDPDQQTQEEVYVVYGGPNLTNLDVAQIKNGHVPGYVIYGDPARPLLSIGMNLNGSNIAGDFNGDGLRDFIFEGQTYDHSDARFYVVLGKQDTSPLRLDQLGNDHNTNGFTITLPQIALTNVINSDSDLARDIVSNCGDINGDGIDDILLTLAFNTIIAGDSANKTSHLLAYIIFGKTDLNNIDLNNLGNSGYKLVELSKTLPSDSTFYGNITAPGDINGDGITDLILDDYYCDHGLLPTLMLGSVDNPSLHQQNKFTYQGNSKNNRIDLNTTDVSETIVGGAGDDTIFGNGGADVIYGGAGNDVIYLNKNNIEQLSLPISDTGRLARVDGGGGIDTLSIDGTNITVDLTHIANNRLQSIEKINLGSNNTLKVSWKDVQDLTSFNIFNDTSGWTGFNSSEVHYHQLVIDGENSNSINLIDEGWTYSSGVSLLNSNQYYDSYINSQHAIQLLIKSGMSVATPIL
jgi:uncharacterized protein (DUF2141 family)